MFDLFSKAKPSAPSRQHPISHKPMMRKMRKDDGCSGGAPPPTTHPPLLPPVALATVEPSTPIGLMSAVIGLSFHFKAGRLAAVFLAGGNWS